MDTDYYVNNCPVLIITGKSEINQDSTFRSSVAKMCYTHRTRYVYLNLDSAKVIA